MEELYKQIIDFVVESGKRIKEKSGKIADIGVTKHYLTEEDIRIERELKNLIQAHYPTHGFFAEEENDIFQQADDVWLADPISGTGAFIRGETSYSIVVSHVHEGQVMFAVIYLPALDELYVAKKGQGSFLNGQQINVSKKDNDFSFLSLIGREWKINPAVVKLENDLKQYKLEEIISGESANYCKVAAGKVEGLVCFVKDIFSATAGGLLIREAGGFFSNLSGDVELQQNDSAFITGNLGGYKVLNDLLKKNEL